MFGMRVPRPSLDSTNSSSSSTTLTENHKRHILSLLPPQSRVVAVASARIYHAPFKARGDDWTYSGLRGLLIFGGIRTPLPSERKSGPKHKTTFVESYWLRLVDQDTGKGVTWMYHIPEGFDYRLDKPFFHYFMGKTRMFGFRFEDDAEAEKFYDKIASRIKSTVPLCRRKPLPPTPTNQLSTAMISPPAPGTFIHVAHMGIDEKGRIEASENVAPGWTMMLKELKGHDPAGKLLDEQTDLAASFWTGVKAASVRSRVQTTDIPVPDQTRTQDPASGKRRRTVYRKPVEAVEAVEPV